MLACFKLRAVPINVNYRYVRDELLYIFDNADMVACIHNREFAPHIAEIREAAPDAYHTGPRRGWLGCRYRGHRFGGVRVRHGLEQSGGARLRRALRRRPVHSLYRRHHRYAQGRNVAAPGRFFAAMGGGGWFHPDGAISAPAQIADRIGDFPIVGMALAPLMHGACWWYACIQLLAGNTVVLNPSRSLVGEEVWDIVAREKVNAISIVGDAMAVPLLDALEANPERWDLSSLFSVGSGGAVFSESKQEAFKKWFPNVFITNSFGSSESGNMGMDGGGRKGEGLGNVNKSDFMSVISDVAGEPHRHVAPGEMGIFARSGHIPVGYYNDPEKTARTIVEVDGKPWLLLGDEARLEEDNSITVYGRGSNCINSGGEKIFPEEVEQALKANPAIFDCLVVATPDARFGSKVTAVVALRGCQRGHPGLCTGARPPAYRRLQGAPRAARRGRGAPGPQRQARLPESTGNRPGW